LKADEELQEVSFSSALNSPLKCCINAT